MSMPLSNLSPDPAAHSPGHPRLPTHPFTFYLATTALDESGFRSLEQLNAVNLIKAVRLYIPQVQGTSYREIAASMGMLDKLTVITRANPVTMGPMTAAALDLGLLAGQQDTGNERIVLVSNQHAVQVIADWAAGHHCDWIILPSLCPAAILELLADTAIQYDKIAIRICKQWVTQQGSNDVRLSDWSRLLFDAYPELADQTTRRSLIGRRRFSEYAKLLGATQINGDHWQYRETLRPRPQLHNLRDAFHQERKRHPQPLFLRWCNRVLSQWPALTDTQVRRWLFGTPSMEKIAKQAGLIRQGQHLSIQVTFPQSQSS